MRVAVARHDALMRTAIESHRGYVFKTVGDAFCAAFSQGGDALAAALEAQRALNAEDFNDVEGLRVRMGMHAGEADEREGDYFGPAVNRVARLMSIGHGGQVLLSSAAREAIGEDLPDGASLVDLGVRRLKDLTQPEQVWQVNVSGLPTEFAPLEEVHTAAHLIGYVNARYKELEIERDGTPIWDYEKLMTSLREQLSEVEIEKLAAEGAAWPEDRAIEEALKV